MTAIAAPSRSTTGPALLALVSAIMWGLWWIPIRFLEDMGLGGAWAGLAMSLGTLPILLIVAATHRDAVQATGKAVAGAILIGVAITLYASALTFTDVLRAVLFFYLAPAWSTAIECLFLGRRWTWRSTLALTLSFAGVIMIFRGDFSMSGWNGGDVMALTSGLFWAAGAALIFTAPPASARKLALWTCTSAIIVGALVLVFGGAQAGVLSGTIELPATTGLAAISGTIYLAPIIIITMWGARRLPPAMFSFLLTAEIVSGVGSSAILLDERFGAPEAIGAVLVALGALMEVILSPLRRTEASRKKSS